MAGRPRFTEAQHFLHDTKSQAKPDKPSHVRGGRPKFPRHLSRAARVEFKRAVALLEARGTITPGDEILLAIYAETYARWIAVKSEIGNAFMIRVTVMDNNGAPHEKSVMNPLLKIAQACESKLASMAKSLSLTPVDKDKARPSAPAPDREIVPGSLADTHAELFGADGKLKVLHMPSAEELASADDAENAEKF